MNDKSQYLLQTPAVDLGQLTNRLGQAWATPNSKPIAQYLSWSENAGIFDFLHTQGPSTLEEITANSRLNQPAIKALIYILLSLNLVERFADGRVGLMPLSTEYLVSTSSFYIGDGLYLKQKESLPEVFLKDTKRRVHSAAMELPIIPRLQVQHSRNFAPCVVAARTGRFDNLHHLVDIAGGSGAFSIPLALDHPQMRITLVELPDVIDACRQLLKKYGVDRKIDLIPMDVFTDEWNFGGCDGIFFGNLFHSRGDEMCKVLARKSFDALIAGGKIWIHEVVFDDQRNGPLIAALWNILMVAFAPDAGQRTAPEIFTFLSEAGFCDQQKLPTAGGFMLLEGTKPT